MDLTLSPARHTKLSVPCAAQEPAKEDTGAATVPRAAAVLERMVNQNIYSEVIMDFKVRESLGAKWAVKCSWAGLVWALLWGWLSRSASCLCAICKCYAALCSDVPRKDS